MLDHAAICDLVAASYGQKPAWQAADDIRAVGTQVGDEYVVAVPGTVNLSQWLIDFSTWPKSFPFIGVYHEGFGLWGLKLAEQVLPALPASGRIIFAGHSLGGQLAEVLAACYAVKTNKVRPMRVVVFGCPRGAFMGNFTAGPLVRSAIDKAEYRNHGDPVPDVPAWPLHKHAMAGTFVGAPVHALAGTMADHAITLYQKNVRAVE